MLEIAKEIVDTIYADATIKAALGAVDADKRIYSWYPAFDITYTTDIPAAILFRISENGRPYKWSYPNQKSKEAIYFRILSIDELVLNQINEALKNLFDNSSLETDNYSVKYIELISSSDGEPLGSPTFPIYVKNTTFAFTNIFLRTV